MTLSTLSLIGILGGLLCCCGMMLCFCNTADFVNRNQVEPENIEVIPNRCIHHLNVISV